VADYLDQFSTLRPLTRLNSSVLLVTSRMQMIDGFNAGWIDCPNRGANARKGSIGIGQAIATMIQRELVPRIAEANPQHARRQ
jgi:hypothetical protein